MFMTALASCAFMCYSLRREAERQELITPVRLTPVSMCVWCVLAQHLMYSCEDVCIGHFCKAKASGGHYIIWHFKIHYSDNQSLRLTPKTQRTQQNKLNSTSSQLIHWPLCSVLDTFCVLVLVSPALQRQWLVSQSYIPQRQLSSQVDMVTVMTSHCDRNQQDKQETIGHYYKLPEQDALQTEWLL